MDIKQQEGEWTVAMSFGKARDVDSPADHALTAVAEEYAVSRSKIKSRVVRYHEDGVTVVVSQSDGH
ncbi:hypothetical protein [Halococcus sp. PRR34]|uniref:hypothetical protein n=1 Tax=Halococcus sp. PRR34 TaxID=3020830 RepID=UPI002362DCD5|nr:hypothetical protein [Halococcus sp. PRR34]